MIGIFKVMAAIDANIIADPAVLVDDGISDIAAMTDSYCWQAMRIGMIDLLQRFVIIIAHKVAAHYCCAIANPRSDANDAAFYPGCIDDTSFGN